MVFKILGFLSTVAVLFWVYYSLLGGTPLLIAKYDTQNDSRLVRGFFHVHYRFLIVFAALGTLSFFMTDNNLLASVMLGEVAVGVAALAFIVARMDRLRGTMIHPETGPDQTTIRSFRQLLSGALALNLMNLLIVTWLVSQSTLITCVKTPPDCDLNQRIDGQPVNCVHRCSLF